MPGKEHSIDGRFVAATQDRLAEAATSDDKYVVYIIDKQSEPYHVEMVIIKNINYPHTGKEVGYLTAPKSLTTPEIVSKSFGMTLEQIYKRLTN